MTEQAPGHPAAAGLGRAAYEAEAAWLGKILPGAPGPSWDDLDPEHREVYQRIAGAVAAAERERIAALADQAEAWCWPPGRGRRVRFAEFMREARSDEKEAGHG